MNKLLIIFLGVILMFTSCSDSPNSFLPGYSGKSGEIILVIDDSHFEDAKETVYQTVARYQHGMPQAERLFSIVNIPHENFRKIFKVNRNIIIADIAPNNVKKIEIKKSVWAKEQLVATISAGSVETFNKILEENVEKLISKFQAVEIDRLIDRNKKFGTEEVFEKHKLKIVLQKDAEVSVDSSDFVWIRIERERPVGGTMHQISQGVFIYHRPYTDTTQFNPEALINYKDSITKKYVPGPSAGSYMTTSNKYILPDSRPITFKKQYGVRTTGLWKMENSYMGGPFVSITTLDEKNGRLVTVGGYVFAPQFEKREFLREVEAIMHSVEFL